MLLWVLSISAEAAELDAKNDKQKRGIEKEKEEKESDLLPDLINLQLQATDPLLQPIDVDMFKKISSDVIDIDWDFLNISLQFWINKERDPKWNNPWFADWKNLMLDPTRKSWVETINTRINALDKAFQIKKRLEIEFDPTIVIGNLLPAFNSSYLRFMLMTDKELARLKISDIPQKCDNKKLWQILCNRLHQIAVKANRPPLPKLDKAAIPNLLLIDLLKIKADLINSFIDFFPRITFLLIDLNEFKNIDLNKLVKPEEIVDVLFEGPYGDGENSTAARRVLSCTPETIYQLSPFLPKLVWGLLSPSFLARLDFSQIFSRIKEEEHRKRIIETIFEGPYGDGKKSPGCKASKGYATNLKLSKLKFTYQKLLQFYYLMMN